MSFKQSLALLSVASLAMIACGGAEGSPADADSVEQVGETSAALCSDAAVAANANLVLGSAPGQSTSPSANYGTAACPQSYVVDITGTKGKTFDLSATWGDALPSTKASCPFALVSATAFGEEPAHWVKAGGFWKWVPAAWVQLGVAESAGGTWTDPGGPGEIQWTPVGCSLHLGLAAPNAANYSKVRVAAKASAFAIFSVVPKRVTVAATVVSIPK
jgi:hypothetical protein